MHFPQSEDITTCGHATCTILRHCQQHRAAQPGSRAKSCCESARMQPYSHHSHSSSSSSSSSYHIAVILNRIVFYFSRQTMTLSCVVVFGSRQHKAKVTPGTHLAQVLADACAAWNLDDSQYELISSANAAKAKPVDLGTPWRLAGLANNVKKTKQNKKKKKGKNIFFFFFFLTYPFFFFCAGEIDFAASIDGFGARHCGFARCRQSYETLQRTMFNLAPKIQFSSTHSFRAAGSRVFRNCHTVASADALCDEFSTRFSLAHQ
jgi:hypothetical protein